MVETPKERYFDLSFRDQADLLHSLAPVMGRRAEILEKDIWLCLVLGLLFSLPCRKPMAFKGGTSLSKVYKVIDRFSEDIDITIDYRSLMEDAPELASLTTNGQRSKLSEALKTALFRHIVDELVPALQGAIAAALPNLDIDIKVSDDAEKLWVMYPSALESTDSYISPSILIEFGGRNSTLPQNSFVIKPDVADRVMALDWPTAQVTVLSAKRTFWEKATLIHVECQRPATRASAHRISRHWYDLARLADHTEGQQALLDRALLGDVLNIKETFYRSSTGNYDLCRSGGLRLVPEAHLRHVLQQDYQAMIAAQMFYATAPSFDDILEKLIQLEIAINDH